MMKTHDIAFADRPDSSVNRRLLYDNKDVSVSPYGEYWRQLKSVCVLQLLSNKRVQSFHHIREEETALMVKKIRDELSLSSSSTSSSSTVVNLSDTFTQVTNHVVCRSAFGRKCSEDEKGRKFMSLLTEMLELLGTLCIGEFVPWLWWIGHVNGFDARVDKVSKHLDELLEDVIKERETAADEHDTSVQNFVDILVEAYQNNTAGVSIDRDSVKAILLDVFAAGTDTTSTVLEWGMSELLQHPTTMKKLQNEVRRIVEGDRDITYDDLEQMHYLKAVIKETLRLHTPIPLLVPRMARQDIKVMGYDILAGTIVMTNAWAIGRDPAVWEEPEKFKPDRFLNSSVDFRGFDFELIPFGAGRRGCPAISYAVAVNELVLANLVHKFEWKLCVEGEKLDMSERPGVSIRRAVPLVAVASQYMV